MSHPTPTTLYRIGAGSGVGSALILLVNARSAPRSPRKQDQGAADA